MFAVAGTLSGLALNHASGAIVTFEELITTPESFRNGSDVSGKYSSQGVDFSNNYSPDFGGYWSGFAISNTTDSITPGYPNQYSAITGSGADGSATYAVSYAGNASIKLPALTDLTGLNTSITNTTYTALSMQNGDSFAKKFGGDSGNDADYFKLTLNGFANGSATGTSLDFFLADFRFDDNSLDYIVRDWTLIDLTSLGQVDEIRFRYESSDAGQFGINTPIYFAIDNVPVPEPGTSLLGLLGALALLRRQRH